MVLMNVKYKNHNTIISRNICYLSAFTAKTQFSYIRKLMKEIGDYEMQARELEFSIRGFPIQAEILSQARSVTFRSVALESHEVVIKYKLGRSDSELHLRLFTLINRKQAATI